MKENGDKYQSADIRMEQKWLLMQLSIEWVLILVDGSTCEWIDGHLAIHSASHFVRNWSADSFSHIRVFLIVN